MKEELLKGLTEEQIAKVKACKNQEEILQLAKEEGIELNEAQLEAVNGGGCMTEAVKPAPCCPYCDSTHRELVQYHDNYTTYLCSACHRQYKYYDNGRSEKM